MNPEKVIHLSCDQLRTRYHQLWWMWLYGGGSGCGGCTVVGVLEYDGGVVGVVVVRWWGWWLCHRGGNLGYEIA